MELQIIAELAQGFEGNIKQAKLLLKAAASAGANAAKYQLVYADELATTDYKYYDLFKSLEMPDCDWQELAVYAAELGIALLLDIFGSKSLSLAQQIGVDAVKLHGTDIANINLLNEVASSNVSKVLLGAGGAHKTELAVALDILQKKDVVILLGFQGYPTNNEDNQVARVRLLNDTFKLNGNISVGFADHADPGTPLSYALAATAIGAGAIVLEKHLTLGKVMKMEDHEAALNPDEFSEFAEICRSCSHALGQVRDEDDFGMNESEDAYRKMIRRHVVAGKFIPQGTIINPADLVLKRTSSMTPLTSLNEVYHKTANCDIQLNNAVLRENIHE